MLNIVGTTMTINDYLSRNDVKLVVRPRQMSEQNIYLSKDRTYYIPLFQRELRWTVENVNVLIVDLARGSRFLGNVILSMNSEGNKCQIIDGQQRTTIIRIIIEYIRSVLNDSVDLFELCPIQNQSFPGFEELVSAGLNENKFTATKLAEIYNGDVYRQTDRIKKIWKTLEKSEILNDRYKVRSFIENLKASQVNVIASYSDSEDGSIRYFLDVNLKGVKLDTEDIFKGYLFSQDSRKEIKTLWQENKKLSFEFNTCKNGENEKRYPLMKIYEHYLYCDLYLPKENGQDFSKVKFAETFYLTSRFDAGQNTFYTGTHIIEVIGNNAYLFEALTRIKLSIEIMIDIIANEGPSDNFKRLFVCSTRIDHIDISNCYLILKRILLDKQIVPKVLALKYILTLFDGKEHEKCDYKLIYPVFVAGVNFSVFASKKESEAFYGIVKSNAWDDELKKWLVRYLASPELTKSKILLAYKYSQMDGVDEQQQIACKSLATIINFVKIIKNNDGEIIFDVTNFGKFNKFLTDSTKFSVEHFIIGESGKLKVKTSNYEFDYTYPSQIKRYRNSLFNYIFIPEELNKKLDVDLLDIKLDKVADNIDDVECSYSQQYCGFLKDKKYFANYPTNDTIDEFDTEEKVKDYLDNYFLKQFPDELLEFSTELVKALNILDG